MTHSFQYNITEFGYKTDLYCLNSLQIIRLYIIHQKSVKCCIIIFPQHTVVNLGKGPLAVIMEIYMLIQCFIEKRAMVGHKQGSKTNNYRYDEKHSYI